MTAQSGGRVAVGGRGVVMLDVARRAGVSQKTVSRVVNEAPYVSSDVRERVLAAINDLGYRPNVAARALALQRTHAIGVLAAGTPLFGPATRVFSLEHAARRHGYQMVLATLPDLAAPQVAAAVEHLLQRGVEGLIVEVPTHLVAVDPAQLKDLPVVTSAGRIAGIRRQSVIDVDQAEVSRQLTQHLLDLGHKTVWHVAGPADWDATQKRLQGWRSALRENRRRVPRLVHGDWSARSGYVQGQQLADRDDVTAVFAANDHMAMGLLRAFAEAGRRIPDDVSIAGFDDVPEAEFQMVPLSTVRTDPDDAAERILSELVTMIEGGEPSPRPVVLPARLVLRSSTGPHLGT